MPDEQPCTPDRRAATILNKRNGWSGHLWANRFLSTPLDEAHQWQAIRYVERNPVAAWPGVSPRVSTQPRKPAASGNAPAQAALAEG